MAGRAAVAVAVVEAVSPQEVASRRIPLERVIRTPISARSRGLNGRYQQVHRTMKEMALLPALRRLNMRNLINKRNTSAN